MDPDPRIQVDQVDLVDLVNLVNLGPRYKWTKVAKWTQTPRSKLTKFQVDQATWSTWVPVPGGPS